MKYILFALCVTFPIYISGQSTTVPGEEAQIRMIINNIEQAIKQHRPELALQHFAEDVFNGNDSLMPRSAIQGRLNRFLQNSGSRKLHPNWKRRTPRPDLKANWDFELNVDKVTIANNNAIVKLEYNWLSNIPFVADSTAGVLNSPNARIQDTWFLTRIDKKWRIKKVINFINFMKFNNNILNKKSHSKNYFSPK